MRVSLLPAALAAALAFASAAHAGTTLPPGGGPVGDPGDDPDPSDDPITFSTVAPADPDGAAGFSTFTTTFNGALQGGFAAQHTPIGQIGQVFTATAGTLNQISFADSNSSAGGVQLVIQKFDKTGFTTVGSVLYSTTIGALAGMGDHSGVGGVDAYYYHTFSGIDLDLTGGQSYYAYLTPTAGSQVFNGSSTKVQSTAYFFLLGSIPTSLGGEMAWEQGGHYYQSTATPHPGSMQALYNISITPAAVPEPTSWALMLGGFGMVGGALRSRKRTAVSFG